MRQGNQAEEQQKKLYICKSQQLSSTFSLEGNCESTFYLTEQSFHIIAITLHCGMDSNNFRLVEIITEQRM